MKLTDELKPRMLLVLYSKNQNSIYGRQQISPEDVYFEFAPIVDGKAGAAVPLSDEVSAHLGIMLSTAVKVEVGGFISPNLMYCSFNGLRPSMMWYSEPHKRRLLYDKSLGMTELTINLPYLLWFFNNKQVNVFATKERPTLKTKLYKAPFVNINREGVVCMGSGTQVIDRGAVTFTDLIKLVEKAFYGTYFTHQTDTNVVKGNLISIQKKLNGINKPFPLDILVPSPQTIKKLVNGKFTTTHEEGLFEEPETDAQNEET